MTILLSIKPEFTKKIFAGTKKFEFRKVSFKRKVSRVVIYCTAPVAKIVGEFEVTTIYINTPERIWSFTKDSAGISQEAFKEYFKHRSTAIAIGIGKVLQYKVPIAPKTGFRPPQSFQYI